MRFRYFVESGIDIFGFEREKEEELANDELDNKPTKGFDTDLMMRFLSRHKIGVTEAIVPFMNEINWGGNRYGAVKLEVSPRMIFLISRLGKDIQGNPRWITKRTFQLNRNGYGGYEEAVAAEVYDYVKIVSESGLEGPNPQYDELPRLADYMATKLRRCAQQKFLYRGIKKVNEDNYLVVFEVGAQGVEAKDHRRVEENITDLSYDKACGTIRVRNYNIESKVGGPHAWKPMPAWLDLYFFPSQDRSEICESFMVLMKYF